MSYLVIARRFRPQTFASIAGQEHISRALSNAIIRGRLAHALLFTGPRGVGKTTSARVLARALNCTGRDLTSIELLPDEEARKRVEPCGECTNCVEIARGSSLACREIDGASNNSVDNVRELIESLRTLPPPGARYKIYLIDEVHMLSTAAFNALLKSLEEPPPNTIFIFATTDPQKIPETVLSRCQQFDFRRLPRDVVIENLRQIAAQENVTVEEEVLRLIARKAQGGMRDGQSLLDRLFAFSEKELTLSFAQEVFGVADGRALARIADAIFSSNPAEALSVVAQLFDRSLDVRGFIADFITYFRNLFILSVSPDGSDLAKTLDLGGDFLAEMRNLVRNKEGIDLQRLYQIAQETGDRALMSSFPRYVVEAGIARMAALPSLRPLSRILSDLAGGSTEPRAVTPALAPASKSNAPLPPAPRMPAPEPAASSGFNPSWVDFVHHAKAGGAPLLAQFLKRVSARRFADGKLEIEGSPFDIEHLKEPSALEALKKALQSYSPELKWEISIHETKSTASLQPASDSLAAQEEDTKRLRREQVNREVREDPLVQAALSTFQGSKIDRISILKE